MRFCAPSATKSVTDYSFVDEISKPAVLLDELEVILSSNGTFSDMMGKWTPDIVGHRLELLLTTDELRPGTGPNPPPQSRHHLQIDGRQPTLVTFELSVPRVQDDVLKQAMDAVLPPKPCGACPARRSLGVMSKLWCRI